MVRVPAKQRQLMPVMAHQGRKGAGGRGMVLYIKLHLSPDNSSQSLALDSVSVAALRPVRTDPPADDWLVVYIMLIALAIVPIMFAARTSPLLKA